MAKKKNKLVKIILLTGVILLVGGFIVNWFLTYRLENLLRKELSQRVSQATDGFYQLDFDKLDIGLFNGELTIDGIVFKPDSAVFNQWSQKDSLPQTYFDVTIGTIHFKGLNLTWLISYKELNFDLFEIKTPFINIYDSRRSGRTEQTVKNTSSKTPYELISTYIDVLTVKQMNLENASVVYSALEHNGTATYALKNVSFHAYGFRLDESSYQKGKLLYSDDFDFTTNQSQILLSNNQFILNTDTIRLSTKDSIIQINKLSLIPQKMLWAQTNQLPDSYVEANVKSVGIRGVEFTRKNARNYLHARAFDILSSDIQYFETKRDSIDNKSVHKNKSVTPKEAIDLSWTLYAIIYPLLESISIDNIGIKDARLAYSVKSDSYTDLYKMEKFDFNALDFKVDSLADTQKKFLYSEGFNVEATRIDGTMPSKNHIFSIDQMYLNTIEGNFDIKKVKLWPISTHSDMDYVQGSIGSISVSGLEYEKGLKATEFTIDTPVVEYVKVPAKKRHYIRAEKADTIVEGTTPLEIITPFFGFLFVEKINLNQGNIIFVDRRNAKDVMIYKIPQIDFHATNVLVDKNTITNTDTYVKYDNFDFRFANFDNLLPGKQYRLIIKRGFYTGWGGDLHLKNIQLIPQVHSWKEAPDTYISLSTPSVDMKALNFGKVKGVDVLKSSLVNINSPQIKIIKAKQSTKKSNPSAKRNDAFRIDLGLFNVTNADVSYKDKVGRDSINASIDALLVKSLAWNSGEKLSVDELTLQSPVVNIKKYAENKTSSVKKNTPRESHSFAELVHVRKINVSDLKFNLDQPSLKLKAETPSILANDIQKTDLSFQLGAMQVSKPIVKINQIVNSDRIKQPSSDSNPSKDLYAVLGGFSPKLSIRKFDIADAEIDYSNTSDGKPVTQQQINSTNFNFEGLVVDADNRKIDVDDFNFSTKNFRFPLDNGFYTLQIGEIDVHKKDESLRLNQLNLVPAYPKEEFAYHHPKHKDWFDVSVGNIVLSGIDYPNYFSQKILNVKDAKIEDVKLLNYKNQQIEIQHNIMPMIYEGLQKAPLKLNIENAEVNNFMVQYEELPKGGTEAGKIFFTDMNGKFEGLTNIVTRPQQYIKLDADGKLMGTGHFTATWYLPVDSLNDRFLLTANLGHFDLTELNQLITPMAPAKVGGGIVNNLIFKTEASSRQAEVQMRFLYNGLNVNIFKSKDESTEPNKLYSALVNAALKKDNPDKRKKKPREPYLSVARDPYHSTFNYLWQILQPPVVESVGISQGKQNFFKGVMGFVSKVKNIFKKKDKKPKEENENI